MLRIAFVVLLLMAGVVQAAEGGGGSNAAGNVWEGFKKGMRDIGQTITNATTPAGGNRSNAGKDDKRKDKDKDKDEDEDKSRDD